MKKTKIKKIYRHHHHHKSSYHQSCKFAFFSVWISKMLSWALRSKPYSSLSLTQPSCSHSIFYYCISYIFSLLSLQRQKYPQARQRVKFSMFCFSWVPCSFFLFSIYSLHCHKWSKIFHPISLFLILSLTQQILTFVINHLLQLLFFLKVSYPLRKDLQRKA